MRSEAKISKKVFKELAKKNVKKSAKDYFIYFFTLTAAICLFYTFNSIGAQFAVFQIPDTLNYLAAAQGAMAGVSLLVCGIIGFLVVYANRFLMKQRRKEFGIYSVLGMGWKDIRTILMKETFLIGAISLIFGIVLGIFVSQGLTMITGRIAGMEVSNYTFIVSGEAILAAIVFFGIIFLCVHILNARQIRRMKLIDLIYGDRKNEEISEKKRPVLSVFALLLIAAGYFTILKGAYAGLFASLSGGSLLIGVGTIFLFWTTAGAVIEFLKRRKSFYYRKLNLFVVNQLGSRMRSAGVSIGVVCILMYLSVSMIGIGLGLGQSSIMYQEERTPYDVSVEYYFDEISGNTEAEENGIESALRNQGGQIPSQLERTVEINIYEQPDLKAADLFAEGIQGNQKILDIIGDEAVWYVGVEDFNKVRVFQGKDPITLGNTEYAITYNLPEAKEILKRYQKANDPVKLADTTLYLKSEGIYEMTFFNRNRLMDFAILVVPQNMAEQSQLYLKVMGGMFKGDKEAGYEALLNDMQKHGDFLYYGKKDIEVEILSEKLISVYIGSYLGIIFLVTAGAVLALQQLSQATDNKKRYDLLDKMGAGKHSMKKSLLIQMMIYFGLPFGVAAVHSGVVMACVYRSIPYLTRGEIAGNILFASCMAVILYAIYFMATYSGSKRILKL